MRERFRPAVLGAVLLLLITNAVVFLRIGSNRGGVPDAELEFSERELQLQTGSWSDESTGVAFLLRMGSPEPYDSGAKEWLDRDKLRALGFDLEQAEKRLGDGSRRDMPSRQVFIAMELAGPAWLKTVEDLRRLFEKTAEKTAGVDSKETEKENQSVASARSRWEGAQESDSRLFVIDADRDPEALRARHPDRAQVAIAPAEVRLYVYPHSGDASPEVRGTIYGPLVSHLHLPKHFADRLLPVGSGVGTDGSRLRPHPGRSYSVRVRYGSRYEPWIENVETRKEKVP